MLIEILYCKLLEFYIVFIFFTFIICLFGSMCCDENWDVDWFYNVTMSSCFLWQIVELNTFFLKHILYVPTSHWLNFYRVGIISLIVAPSLR